MLIILIKLIVFVNESGTNRKTVLDIGDKSSAKDKKR
jgi:hypothetical protein